MFAINLLVMAFVMSALLLGGLSVFAIGEPLNFIRWVTPLNWITLRIFHAHRKRAQFSISYFCGIFMLLVHLMVCFALGGWFTTAFMGLWTSPFLRIFEP